MFGSIDGHVFGGRGWGLRCGWIDRQSSDGWVPWSRNKLEHGLRIKDNMLDKDKDGGHGSNDGH